MTVEYLKALLVTAEEMLTTAGALPKGPARDQAVQMVQDYIFSIERLISAIELALNVGMF
jgi:hypothetical protein